LYYHWGGWTNLQIFGPSWVRVSYSPPVQFSARAQVWQCSQWAGVSVKEEDAIREGSDRQCRIRGKRGGANKRQPFRDKFFQSFDNQNRMSGIRGGPGLSDGNFKLAHSLSI
jgi:hypothetical protein